jgi:L-ascorbate metabolism protein UlaG (beta-lactamase superfamily)
MPGVHARGLLGVLLPPVMGTVLERRRAARTTLLVYVSGDTLSGDQLDEVAQRYPHLDAAAVALGGRKVLTRTVTMDGAQGANAMRRLAPRRTLGAHYDDGRFRSPCRTSLTALPTCPGEHPHRPARWVPAAVSTLGG